MSIPQQYRYVFWIVVFHISRTGMLTASVCGWWLRVGFLVYHGRSGICEFEIGDGIGGTEQYVGTTRSAMDCVDLVTTRFPLTANGATFRNDLSAGSNDCYAEFGMVSSNGNNVYQTCKFTGTEALPCSDTTEFERYSHLVTAECCDASSSCTGGLPSVCSAHW
jgi:hypothetical protein